MLCYPNPISEGRKSTEGTFPRSTAHQSNPHEHNSAVERRTRACEPRGVSSRSQSGSVSCSGGSRLKKIPEVFIQFLTRGSTPSTRRVQTECCIVQRRPDVSTSPSISRRRSASLSLRVPLLCTSSLCDVYGALPAQIQFFFWALPSSNRR